MKVSRVVLSSMSMPYLQERFRSSKKLTDSRTPGTRLGDASARAQWEP